MGAFRFDAGERLGWRDVLLALALFASVVRSLIPVGFMPEVRDGQLSIVICTFDGAKQIPGENPSRGSLQDAMAAVHGPCAFAALATLAPPPSAAIVSLPAALETHIVSIDDAPQGVAPPHFRAQAQRAPPIPA